MRARRTMTAAARAVAASATMHARRTTTAAATVPTAPTTPPSRAGELTLEYENRRGKTIPVRSSCSYPWYAFPPLYLDHTGCATTFLGNPSGGFAGGDTCSLHATLGRDTHVIFATPSATRIYRTDATAPARQTIDVTVGPNARLEWLPDLTIPFAGSRFEQRITVRLEAGASLILRDAVAAGRVARGERWAFSQFDNHITVTSADRRSLDERYALAPDGGKGCLTFEQGWDYVGSLFIVHDATDATDAATWTRTIGEALAAAIEERSGRVLGGVSAASVPGLVVKIVARAAPDLNETLDHLWRIARMSLWNIEAPDLRRG